MRRAVLRALRRDSAVAWKPVEHGWRCAATPELEVQVVRVPEIGWGVELRDSAASRLVGRPTFSPRLEDATRIARYLCARYACGPASSPE